MLVVSGTDEVNLKRCRKISVFSRLINKLTEKSYHRSPIEREHILGTTN